MPEIASYAALVAALVGVITIIGFVRSRGAAEATMLARADAAARSAENAIGIANAAVAKADLLASQVAQARLEDAREYATNKDLAHAEMRMTSVVDGLRGDVQGMNQRLDRVLENFHSKPN